MSKTIESGCGCGSSGKSNSTGRAVVAGAFGGMIGVAVLAGLAAFMVRRLCPQVMERMMRNCACSSDTDACMDSCCGGSCDADETPTREN
jgi:hypothetical protein